MIRIKNLHDGAIKMLHSKNHKYQKYDRDLFRNETKLYRLFSDTLSGKIKGFYLISEKSFKAYHKSTKEAGKIQLSSGYYENNELIPCYDCQFGNFKELIQEGYTSGLYEIIK